MRILRHGENVVDMPKGIKVYCPECGEENFVVREVEHDETIFGKYIVKAFYTCTCKKCKCRWEDEEKKSCGRDMHNFGIAFTALLIALNFLFKILLIICMIKDGDPIWKKFFIGSVALSGILYSVIHLIDKKGELK